MHGLGNLDKASDVAAGHEAGHLALLALDVVLGRLQGRLEAVLHDGLELLVDLLRSPAQTLRVNVSS